MHDIKWSPHEKKVARAAFDYALETALAKIMTEFKAKASAVATPSEMWEIEDYLRQERREVEAAFDYRYSQLLTVFAGLIFQGHLDEGRLTGLSEEKLAEIRSIVSFVSSN